MARFIAVMAGVDAPLGKHDAVRRIINLEKICQIIERTNGGLHISFTTGSCDIIDPGEAKEFLDATGLNLDKKSMVDR